MPREYRLYLFALSNNYTITIPCAIYVLHISCSLSVSSNSAFPGPRIDARPSGRARFDQQIGTNLRQGRATADPDSIIDRCQLRCRP